MAALVEGEGWAVQAFFDVATGPVRGIALARFREANIWVTADRLDDIVRDLVVELIELAPSWRPDGGALPWVWARSRLWSLAFARLGPLADDIEDHELVADGSPAGGVGGHDGSPVETLRQAARDRTDVTLLLEALDQGVSERDADVWLDVLSEQAAGNRSPSVTVAQQHDLTPCAVRKICQRVRRRLGDLGAAEARFAPLLALPALAA